jgi:arylformamidase
VAEYRLRSRDALALDHQVVRFGADPEEVAVVFPPPGGERPVLVFVHGGYWQELSVWDSLFLAPAAVGHGHGFAAVGYPLAPTSSVPEIGAAVKRGVDAAARALASQGWAGRLVLAGHSAGAQLAVAVAGDPPAGTTVERLVVVSGVFDLEPLVGSTIDGALGLDDASVQSVSPLRAESGALPDTVVVVGQDETELFHCWSDCFAAHARGPGRSVEHVVVPGRHHFDVVLEATGAYLR